MVNDFLFDDYSARICDESTREFTQLQTYRALFGQQWEEISELILPTSRNTFFFGSYNMQGQKKTERQVDSNGAIALTRFAAILDSLLTPRNMTWHGLETSNPQVNKDRAVKLYFENVTRILFRERYAGLANFSANNNNHYTQLGAFGTAPMLIDAYQGRKGLRYYEIPLGEYYMRENHQKVVDGFCRWFRFTPIQAIQAFDPKNDPDNNGVPDRIKELASQNSQLPIEFLHRVCPRDDYIPGHLSKKGKPFASYTICLTEKWLCREKGYTSFPVATSRYEQTPGETYGRSPAMMVLPALKTLNAQKKDFLTQGHRAAVPVLLTYDDGVVDMNMRPGSINKGGVGPNGEELIKILPSGQIQVSETMMDKEVELINAAFLTDLFKVLLGDPKIFTATQVVEMMSQRGILIAPAIGRQQSEYCTPMIERELDVLARQGMLPPMPPLLREAKGEYKVIYQSPLARDMRAQEVAGFSRSLETAMTVMNATQDPSVLDTFDFEVAFPAIMEIQGVPSSWTASPAKIAAKQQARAQAAQQKQQVDAMPAQAAMLNARAKIAKAGVTPEQNVQPPQSQQ